MDPTFELVEVLFNRTFCRAPLQPRRCRQRVDEVDRGAGNGHINDVSLASSTSCQGRPVAKLSLSPESIQKAIDSTTSYTHCASHVSAVVLLHSRSINLPCQSRSYSSSILGMQMKNSEESWQSRAAPQGSAKAQWLNLLSTSGGAGSKISNKNEKHVDICNVGVGYWLVHTFKPNTDCVFLNCQTLHQANHVHHPKKSDSDNFDDGAPIDRTPQREQVSQTGSPITAQRRSYVPSQSWQSCWQDRWWEYSQDSWDQTEHRLSRRDAK